MATLSKDKKLHALANQLKETSAASSPLAANALVQANQRIAQLEAMLAAMQKNNANNSNANAADNAVLHKALVDENVSDCCSLTFVIFLTLCVCVCVRLFVL